MAANILPNGKNGFQDANGDPLNGGKLYTYSSGTLTPRATYADAGSVTPNANPIILDSRGEALIYWTVGVAYRIILEDSLGNVIWSAIDNISGYAPSANDIGLLLYPRSAAEISAGVTPTAYNYPYGNVLRFGADPTGIADSYTAIANTWASIKATGGTLLFPPGTYLHNTQILFDADLTLPHSYLISGFGAFLKSGSSVTGFSILAYKGYNQYGMKFDGLSWDHRGNANVAGCIQAQGASNITVEQCSVDLYGNKAGYAGIELGPYTVGNADTNTFWATIDRFNTRPRSGADQVTAVVTGSITGDVLTVTAVSSGVLTVGSVLSGTGISFGCQIISLGTGTGGTGTYNVYTTGNVGSITITAYTYAAMGVRFRGAANRARVLNCSFIGLVDAIRLETDGTATSLPNSVVIQNNACESAVNFVTVNTAAPSNAMITGLRVEQNSIESTQTFFNITGPFVTDQGYPPILRDNYLTVGSVINYIRNTNAQMVKVDEPSYFGVGSPETVLGGPADFNIITEGTGKNTVLQNISGLANYAFAHLVMGVEHLWPDTNLGRVFTKTSAPASAQDGAMMGTINGTATFAAAATVVVNIGYTMESASYNIAIDARTNRTFWTTGKSTTQFTINAAAANSDTVGWILTQGI